MPAVVKKSVSKFSTFSLSHEGEKFYLYLDQNQCEKFFVKRFQDLKAMYDKYEFTEAQKEAIKNEINHYVFYFIMVDLAEIVYAEMADEKPDPKYSEVKDEIKKRIAFYFPGKLVQLSRSASGIEFVDSNFENDPEEFSNLISVAAYRYRESKNAATKQESS